MECGRTPGPVLAPPPGNWRWESVNAQWREERRGVAWRGVWEARDFGVRWGDSLPALPFTNSLTSVRITQPLSETQLPHSYNGDNKASLGGQKQAIMTYEERLYRLEGAVGKECIRCHCP